MYERGTVVVAADPFGNTPRRPYLLLSDDSHPFAGTQSIAAGISTKEYNGSLPLAGAFVSPWAVVALRETNIERVVAQVTDTVTDDAAEQLADYVTG